MPNTVVFEVTVPSAVYNRLHNYAGDRSIARVARECLIDGFGRRLANGVAAVRHANPTRGSGMSLVGGFSEESRPHWERVAARMPVPRKVAAFLLGRCNTYVSCVTSAMKLDGYNIDVSAVRSWLIMHPEFRANRKSAKEPQKTGLLLARAKEPLQAPERTGPKAPPGN